MNFHDNDIVLNFFFFLPLYRHKVVKKQMVSFVLSNKEIEKGD